MPLLVVALRRLGYSLVAAPLLASPTPLLAQLAADPVPSVPRAAPAFMIGGALEFELEAGRNLGLDRRISDDFAVGEPSVIPSFTLKLAENVLVRGEIELNRAIAFEAEDGEERELSLLGNEAFVAIKDLFGGPTLIAGR